MSSQETASIRQTAEYLIIAGGIAVTTIPLHDEKTWESRLTHYAHSHRHDTEAIRAAIDMQIPRAVESRLSRAILLWLRALQQRIAETLPPSKEQLEHQAKVAAWIDANVHLQERYVPLELNELGRQEGLHLQEDE